MQATVAQPTKANTELTARLGRFMKFLMANTSREFFTLIGELDLTMSQIRILHVLVFDREEASVKQIADVTGLSMAAASRSIDSLVQRGLVTRDENAEDRRLKTLRVTESGKELTDRLIGLRLAGLGEFVATLPPHERDALSAALAPIVDRADVAPLRAEEASPAPAQPKDRHA